MKKLLTVFLIVALVMSFFAACDTDTGGGGGKKTTPGQEEKSRVWQLSLLAGYLSDIVYWQYNLDEDNFIANVNDFLVDNPILDGTIVECLDTTKVTVVEGIYYVDLAFKSIDSSDNDFALSGSVIEPEDPISFDITTMSVTFATIGKTYTLSAKGTLSENNGLIYSKVVLNGVQYDPSYFNYVPTM